MSDYFYMKLFCNENLGENVPVMKIISQCKKES